MNNMMISRERQQQLSMTETSDFYNACLANDIPRIKSYLASPTFNEINRIEPNGGTALHASCYYHNAGVVYLLLRHGALGSIKNRYGLTPYEETTSPYIKQLLSSTGNVASIEWTFVNPPSRETKQIFDTALETTFRTRGLPFILDYLHHHYVRRYVAEALPMSMQKIDQ
jgi:ankyrin repeat protein